MRRGKWNAKYNENCFVMWDDTNLTFSSYYNENSTKGGAFLQLSGWLGVEELWVGSMSDMYYQEKQ
eukprot:1978039-Ditylum_brightwellii.AAC.1